MEQKQNSKIREASIIAAGIVIGMLALGLTRRKTVR